MKVALYFSWITLMMVIILVFEMFKNNNKHNKKTRKNKIVKNTVQYPTIRKTKMSITELKDELHRAEFDVYVHKTFRGMLYWEPLEDDIADNYESEHMIKVTYTDGTYEIVDIDVSEGEPRYSGEEQDSDDVIEVKRYSADDWINDNRKMLLEKFRNKEDFVLDEEYFPVNDIHKIIDRISETGMFNIFYENHQVKFFAVE